MIAPLKMKKGAGRPKAADAQSSPQNGAKHGRNGGEINRRGAEAQSGEYQLIPVGETVRCADNREIDVECEGFAELRESIVKHGVLQPIVVRVIERDAALADCGLAKYEIVIGERRWRACQDIGVETMPAIVKRIDDGQAMEERLVENLQREDLRPMDEARGYKRLADMGLSAEEIGTRVGKKKSAVYARLKLLELDPATARAVESGRLPASHAELLTTIKDPEVRQAASVEIMAPDCPWRWNLEEGELLPFRAAKEVVEDAKAREENLQKYEARKVEFEAKGRLVLPAEDTRTARNSSNWIELDDWCAAAGKQWSKVVPAKLRPEPALGCEHDGKPVEFYDEAAMRTVAEAAGVKFSSGRSGKRAKARVRRAVWDGILAALVAAGERSGPTQTLLRLAAPPALHRILSSGKRAEEVVKRRGLEESGKHRPEAILKGHVEQGFNAKQLCGLILEGLAYNHECYIDFGSDQKWTPGLKGLCEAMGVDIERIERDVRASGKGGE